jgi:hypothetical protein
LNQDNRLQAFADVVAIDAWHKAFGSQIQEVALHADVVFGTACVGDEPEASVRFRLSVRRAEILVIVPETEPITINPETVSRDFSPTTGKLTRTVLRQRKGRLRAALSVLLGKRGVSGSLEMGGHMESKISSTEELKLTTPVTLCIVTQSKSEAGHYRWIVEARDDSPLFGRPWKSDTPRLSLTDVRRDRTKGIAPMVRLEVRCRREDLIIEDLELKDESAWETLRERAGFGNRMAAAESYIRDQLSALGLEVRNIEDKFGRLSLASAIAQPQK